ncbi:MAG: hypothetical protein E7310_05320 [Clostridiales bacterium]|nr:hypothetical protein [Clostridiales bacterium]
MFQQGYLYVSVADGMFGKYYVGKNDPPVDQTIEAKTFSLKGWKGTIKDDNTIECISTERVKGELHTLRIVIYPNGFFKATLKAPNKPITTFYKTRIKTPFVGWLTLSLNPKIFQRGTETWSRFVNSII